MLQLYFITEIGVPGVLLTGILETGVPGVLLIGILETGSGVLFTETRSECLGCFSHAVILEIGVVLLPSGPDNLTIGVSPVGELLRL